MDEAIARLAHLLADPARAAMLQALIDGTTRPAGELAFAANISAQSASGHLAKLVGGGLLAARPQGRHRYFRIASAEVADVVESLAALGTALAPRKVPRAKAAPAAFLRARTCYDHLAGETAVRLCEAMLAARWLTRAGRDFRVSALGKTKLAALGIDLDALRRTRRVFARGCTDLTERRPHVGGALGAALLEVFISRSWILRMPGSRAVTITPKGDQAFAKLCA
jgi:DNA-binding transcriptional ArsR family regulator